MSDEEDTTPGSIGRLTGKTTASEVQILISDPKVERNSYFVIFDRHIFHHKTGRSRHRAWFEHLAKYHKTAWRQYHAGMPSRGRDHLSYRASSRFRRAKS